MQSIGRGIEQVDHRPVGVEEPGSRIDRGDQQAVDVPLAGVGIMPRGDN